ncbi:MAG: glycosyltransferase family 4 protein [Edaphocola sp.]
MKILQLNNRIPYPLNDGGNIGVHYYTQGYLDAGVQLSMLAMNTTRHWADVAALPPIYKRLQHFETVKVDNRIKPLAALANLFTQKSYNIGRFVSSEFEEKLKHLLANEHFDIVQLEGLYLVPYVATIRKYSKAKVVLRQHNIEFRIWERLAAKTTNPLKKWYLDLLARRLKKYELEHLADYDLVLPISKEDEAFFRQLGTGSPTFLHPFGIDVSKIPFSPSTKEPVSLYHIGAMDWLANRESVDWLLEKVVPQLAERMPGLKLHLAGRNMPEKYLQLTMPNVVVHGEVPDAAAFEQDKSVLLVPLQSGGGVRIKIFQAMALGKAIVTTSVGVEGIEAVSGKHLFIANDAAAFAQQILQLATDPKLIGQMGQNARKLLEERYDSRQTMALLLERLQQLTGSE